MSVRTFYSRCRAYGITAKQCVDFLRLLSAVADRRSLEWPPLAPFTDLDPRTTARLLARGRLINTPRPSVSDFLRQQQFISSRVFLMEVEERLLR